MFRSSTRTAAAVNPAQGMKQMVLAVTLAVAGTLAMSAWAEVPGSSQGSGESEHRMRHHGPHGAHARMGGHGLFMGSPEQLDRSVDRYLGRLGATDAQRAQVKQIVQAAAAELKPIHTAQRELRASSMQLFTAPVVDARAVEANRAQMAAQHDQASKRMTQAMLDISTVLTPEQRAKVAEQIKQRQERMTQHQQKRAMKRQGAASGAAQ